MQLPISFTWLFARTLSDSRGQVQLARGGGVRLLRAASRAARMASVRDYVVAVGASSVALAIAQLLSPLDTDYSVAELIFLAAVGVSGWYGGLGPALLATLAGGLAIDYFFERPFGLLEVTSAQTLVDLLAFLVVAILLGSLNARLRLSNKDLRAERDRAQGAVEARDDLLATVSHGLQTPLTVIKGSLFSLHDQSLDLSPVERGQLLLRAEAEADRLSRFVAEALALRKLEDAANPRWEWTTPSELASAALDRSLVAFGQRSIHFAVADDLPAVRVDPRLTDQALTVLLENVAVHTPPDCAMSIEGSVRDQHLRLVVSDAGPGIAPEDRERVFAKYSRANETAPGAGLGLAIARAAVEAQGGRLWLEESVLGGARFVLSIPCAVDNGPSER